MRINVYGEEVTTDTEIVTKTVTDETFGTRTFYGIRMFLASPDVLHHVADDDDRSAITIWVPWTRALGHNFGKVERLFDNLAEEVRIAWGREDEADLGAADLDTRAEMP